MSIPRITGRQARELLEGTTPGPWEPVGADIDSPEGQIGGAWDGEVGRIANAELMAAAPSLAETVAWQEHELRRVVATLTRERGEWIDQEEAAVEHDEHDEASEASAMAEGLDRAIQLLRPLAWPAEEARP